MQFLHKTYHFLRYVVMMNIDVSTLNFGEMWSGNKKGGSDHKKDSEKERSWTTKCVVTTSSRSLEHRLSCYTHTRVRYVWQSEWNCQLTCCDFPSKCDFVGLFGWLSCVITQVHISSCDMKASPGHSRHHLASGMSHVSSSFIVLLKEGRHLMLHRITLVHADKNDQKGKWTYKLSSKHKKCSDIVGQGFGGGTTNDTGPDRFFLGGSTNDTGPDRVKWRCSTELI